MAVNRKSVLLLGAGAFALMLASAGKKGKKKDKTPSQDPKKAQEEEDEEIKKDLGKKSDEEKFDDILESLIEVEGRARPGVLYQVRPGDSILEISRLALYGTRDPSAIQDPRQRSAIMDYAVRIECSPWNQSLYGKPLNELRTGGHIAMDRQFTTLGISFDPVYSDNLERILEMQAPTADEGRHLPLIWLPFIDMERLDNEGVVTLEGMNWPDTEEGRGHSMIDPPAEILKLGYESVATDQPGCNF